MANPAVAGDKSIVLQVVTKQPDPEWLSILLGVGPTVVWAILIGFALYKTFPAIRKELFPRIGKISAFGIEIGLVTTEMAAINLAKGLPTDSPAIAKVVERMTRSFVKLAGSKLLWVDEHPQNNTKEIEVLKRFGVDITLSRTSADALTRLDNEHFAVVVSNMGRGGIAEAGFLLANDVSQHPNRAPVVIYTSAAHVQKLRPPAIFGLTDKPNEFFNLIVDAMERQGG
ncbi:MAG: hypothetical protein AB7O88_03745 [Reyranellaceae bacterium]